MSDDRHRHQLPPGYLGAPPEPTNPQDHRTPPPMSCLPAACPDCGGPLIVHRRVSVDVVRREGGRALPIGDRTDTFMAKCPQHGVVDGVVAVTPAGQPLSPIVDRVLAPLCAMTAPEPRWHDCGAIRAGVYWARRAGEAWRIVEVVRSSLGDDRIFVHVPGTDYVFSPAEFVAWQGPVDPPLPPKEPQ